MLQILIAIVLFIIFWYWAKKAGRSSFGWAFLGVSVFLLCSITVSTVILRTVLPSLPGDSGEGTASAALVLGILGNAVGLGVSTLIVRHFVFPNKGIPSQAEQPFLRELLGILGSRISWKRALGLLASLVAAGVSEPVFRTILGGYRYPVASWFILALGSAWLAVIILVLFRFVRIPFAAASLIAIGYAFGMSGIRWVFNGGEFQMAGTPPRILEPILLAGDAIYAILLLSALALLMRVLRPTWLALTGGMWIANIFYSLCISIMMMSYLNFAFSLQQEIMSALYTLGSSIIFASILIAFAGKSVGVKPISAEEVTSANWPLRMGWIGAAFLGLLAFIFPRFASDPDPSVRATFAIKDGTQGAILGFFLAYVISWMILALKSRLSK
jgi:hypothetical protein